MEMEFPVAMAAVHPDQDITLFLFFPYYFIFRFIFRRKFVLF